MVTHSIEEAALLSDEVLVTGRAPINVVKRYVYNPNVQNQNRGKN